MIVVRAPGKLYIAGEYAVTQPGYPAVLVAVDRYATAAVTEADDIALSSDLNGGVRMLCRRVEGRLSPTTGDPELGDCFKYVLAAIGVVERLVRERGLASRRFHIAVTSELRDASDRKLGLGSSAAVTVATVGAMAGFYRLALSQMDRLRLALLATFAVSPHTSGGDVAASTYGGWLVYRCAESDTMTAVAAKQGIEALLRAPLRGLTVRRLPTPQSISVQVGWTGHPSATGPLIDRVVRTTGYPAAFLAGSRECVDRLSKAIETDDGPSMMVEIRMAGRLLRDLDDVALLGIITPQLATLCEQAEAVGAAAKSSGAGGGDCGIAVIDRTAHTAVAELTTRWRSAGVTPLALHVSPAEPEHVPTGEVRA